MLLLTLNGAFAAAFFFFALRGVQRGWSFVRLGWMTIQTQTAHEDFRQNVHRRWAISEGGRFFVGGLLWLAASLAGFAGAVYFMSQVWGLMNGSV